jgi:hypothetical protein
MTSFLSLPYTQGIELGHVDIISTNELFVPAYNSPVRFLFVDRCLYFLFVLFTRPSRPACVAPYCLSFSLSLQLHLKARHRSLGSHSAVLVDPEQTAVPVTHARYGKTYHMYLENFPASTTLQLDLYRFKVRT